MVAIKKIILSLALCLVSLIVKAQYSLGNSGQLVIPTAEMNEAGTFLGGANYLPEYISPDKFNYGTMNYFVNMTFFSFLELNYRMTLLRYNIGEGNHSYNNQDRSNSIRLLLTKEKKVLPALLLGADDMFTEGHGSQYWGDIYGVMTKTLKTKVGNEWAFTLGWYIPQGPHHFNKGPFGGVRFTPERFKNIKLMAEYDSHHFNIGSAVKLYKHLSINLFTSDFACLAGGVRYEFELLH